MQITKEDLKALPKEIEDLIMDYVKDLEVVEKQQNSMKKVVKQLNTMKHTFANLMYFESVRFNPFNRRIIEVWKPLLKTYHRFEIVENDEGLRHVIYKYYSDGNLHKCVFQYVNGRFESFSEKLG